jgi:hypothetical protein
MVLTLWVPQVPEEHKVSQELREIQDLLEHKATQVPQEFKVIRVLKV